MMKTPTGYVALRKGRNNIRNCIFLQWLDAEEHIIEYNKAEYSVIDTLQDAEKYIINNNNNDNNNTVVVNTTTTTTTAGAAVAASGFDDAVNNNNNNKDTDKTANDNNTRRLEEFTTTTTTTAVAAASNQQQGVGCNNNNNNSNESDNTKTATESSSLLLLPPPLPPATIDDDINDNDNNNYGINIPKDQPPDIIEIDDSNIINNNNNNSINKSDNNNNNNEIMIKQQQESLLSTKDNKTENNNQEHNNNKNKNSTIINKVGKVVNYDDPIMMMTTTTRNIALLEDTLFDSTTMSFPEKIMTLLDSNNNEVVNEYLYWLVQPAGNSDNDNNNNNAFCINKKGFKTNVLDIHFQGTKFESFIRKLNRWGFTRLVGQNIPANTIAFFHYDFIRGKKDLLKEMSGTKSRMEGRRELRIKEQQLKNNNTMDQKPFGSSAAVSSIPLHHHHQQQQQIDNNNNNFGNINIPTKDYDDATEPSSITTQQLPILLPPPAATLGNNNNNNNNAHNNIVASPTPDAKTKTATTTALPITTTITGPSEKPLPTAIIDIEINDTRAAAVASFPVDDNNNNNKIVHQRNNDQDVVIMDLKENNNNQTATNTTTETLLPPPPPSVTTALYTTTTTPNTNHNNDNNNNCDNNEHNNNQAATTTADNNNTCTPSFDNKKILWSKFKNTINDEWKEYYNKLITYRNPNDGTYPKPIPDYEVDMWLYIQKNQYKKKHILGYMNDNTLLDNDQEELLRNIGIDLDDDYDCNDVKNTNNNDINYDDDNNEVVNEQDDEEEEDLTTTDDNNSSSSFDDDEESTTVAEDSYSSDNDNDGASSTKTTTSTTQQQQQQYAYNTSSSVKKTDSNVHNINNIIINNNNNNNNNNTQSGALTQTATSTTTTNNNNPVLALASTQKLPDDDDNNATKAMTSAVTSNKRKINDDDSDDNDNLDNKWKRSFNRLLLLQNKEDGSFPRVIPGSVRGWLRRQYNQYTNSTLSNEKVEMLRNVGVVFSNESFYFEKIALPPPKPPKKRAKTTTTKPKDTITELKKRQLEKQDKAWKIRFDKLASLRRSDGTFQTRKVDDKLRQWLYNQKRYYKNKVCGLKNAFITDERIDLLRSIGIDLNPDEAINNGNNEGDDTATTRKKQFQTWDDEFDAMLAQLKEYKMKYGNSYVIKQHQQEYQALSNWLQRIKNEYRKLSDKATADKSRLSTVQVAQLTEIGVQLTMKPRTFKSFDEWIEELKEFQNNGGDINKQTSKRSYFSTFTSQQRKEYKLRCQGKHSALNERRIKILEDMGFNWNVDKWIGPEERANYKSWDERFQDLLNFKAKHGHTLVPKRMGKLGMWVQWQRQHYKFMIQGKKTLMTPEKAVKLANIGFVFNASEYQFKKVPLNNNDTDDDDDAYEKNDDDNNDEKNDDNDGNSSTNSESD